MISRSWTQGYLCWRRIEALYNTFIKEMLTECTVPITEVLSKNSTPPVKTLSKQKMQIMALKSDCFTTIHCLSNKGW